MAIPHRQVPHQGAMPQNSVVCHWISNPPRPPSGAFKVLVPETDRPARSMMVCLIVFIDKCDLYATYRPYRSFPPRSIDFINITHSPFQPLSVHSMFNHLGNDAPDPPQP